jgi:hypothetical protein
MQRMKIKSLKSSAQSFLNTGATLLYSCQDSDTWDKFLSKTSSPRRLLHDSFQD